MYPLTQMRSPSFNPNIYIERMTLKTAPGTNTKNLNNEGVQKWAIINGTIQENIETFKHRISTSVINVLH